MNKGINSKIKKYLLNINFSSLSPKKKKKEEEEERRERRESLEFMKFGIGVPKDKGQAMPKSNRG